MQELQIYIPPGPRLGNLVIEGNTLTKAFGEKLLFQNFSFNIPPASIVGVIGPNGAGKSTLFKILTNQEKPDSGSIRLGETVKIAHVDQMRESLDRSKSVYDNISGGSEVVMLGNREVNARAYLARFNFSGGDQQKTVGVLSGGEMNRLQLAQVLKTGANVLLLDEPTNDLDIQTLRALEDALEAYAGCAMIISHDRWFLDRICTHIMAFEGDSNVVLFEGNFKDYEEDKVRRLGPESIKPKRIKFKKLA